MHTDLDVKEFEKLEACKSNEDGLTVDEAVDELKKTSKNLTALSDRYLIILEASLHL